MNATPAEVHAGQAIYNRFVLAIYDFVVLGISNRCIWRCPTRRLLAHYDQHVTANHLDVGVGSGYFLDHCRFPSPAPRVALMDLNDNALAFASRRIARYAAETWHVHLHFTPTYSSWLNQVELWFAKIERDVIARGIFTSVADLRKKLMRYIRHYNKAPRTVKWKYADPSRHISTESVGTGH